MEWDGSRLYITNTTPTRNTIAYNPMTSAGDIIYGGTSGVETRLAGSGTDGYVLKYNTATNTPYWAADSVGETGSDVLVAIDGTATAGYLGAAYNDGVLRSTTELSYEDGGDYITLGVADDALDFTELQDTLDLDTSLTLNQTTYTWAQDFTGTTTTGLTYTANSLTSGTANLISSTSTALTTGGLLNISATGAPAAAWSGSLAKIEYDNADADVDGSALKLGLIGTTALGSGTVLNITTSQTGTGALALRVNDDGTYTDTTPFVIDTSGNVGVGTTSLDSILKVKNSNVESPAVYIVQGSGSYTTSNSNLEFGASNSDGTGFPALASVGPYAITVPSSSMEFSSFGRINTFLGNGAPAGARSVHNIVGYQEMTGQDTNANKSFNLYLYADGGAANTSLSGTPSHTNIKSVVNKSSGTSLYNVYGIYSSVAGNTSTNATGYGIYTTISGFGSNYAIYSAAGTNYFAGNVGIGQPSPTAYLHLKAGTAAASTAPLKFTTGVNLTTAESGAMEWDGSRLYMTDTTPTRNTIAYTSDIPISDNYQYWTARADSGTDQNVTSQYILDLEGSGGIGTSIAANKITIGTTGVLEDLNTLGAASAADQFIVSTAAGVFAYESGSTVRTSLGATTVGSNLFTLTNPSAITFLRINADNSVSALSASDFRTAIGAGTGSGTVTSVTAGTGLTADTNPITTTGTISLDYSNTLASNSLALNNTVFGSTGVLFEGATSDTFETLLTLTDPTADNTITLQNNSE